MLSYFNSFFFKRVVYWHLWHRLFTEVDIRSSSYYCGVRLILCERSPLALCEGARSTSLSSTSGRFWKMRRPIEGKQLYNAKICIRRRKKKTKKRVIRTIAVRSQERKVSVSCRMTLFILFYFIYFFFFCSGSIAIPIRQRPEESAEQLSFHFSCWALSLLCCKQILS